MKNILFLLFFAVLCACNQAPQSTHNQIPRREFRTTQPSHLFFKNMRSYYYEQSTDDETQLDYYTLKKFREAPPLILPVIADNWLQDEAYILLQREARLPQQEMLLLQIENEASKDTIHWNEFNHFQDYRLAKRLYQALKRSHKISLSTKKGANYQLFENQSDAANFLRVMNDYFRLTEDYSE